VAKIVLAAGVEAQILAHLRPSRFEEPDQPAVMVEVTVAENQRIDLGRVDVHHPEIVGIDVRGKAEIQQIAPLFAASCRFDVQRETPLAGERLALRRGRKSGPLDGEAGAFERLQGGVVLVVGNLAHDNAIDDRHLNARGCAREADAGRNHRATQRGRALKEAPAIQRCHGILLSNDLSLPEVVDLHRGVAEPREQFVVVRAELRGDADLRRGFREVPRRTVNL